MNLIVFCGDCPMEYRLTHRLVKSDYNLVGIVVESKQGIAGRTKRYSLAELFQKAVQKILFGWNIDRAWEQTQRWFTTEYHSFPSKIDTLKVNNINDKQVAQFCSERNYDLIIVSGTKLLKPRTIRLAGSLGILNLHTGLSPYIKGGPNCTNWCLSEGKFEYIGNSVMYLDEGIDSGNLIATRRAHLNPYWSHAQLLYNVITQGQDLYLESIACVSNPDSTRQGIQQEAIAPGRTYYNREWGILARLCLLVNFYFGRYSRAARKTNDQTSIVEIPL